MKTNQPITYRKTINTEEQIKRSAISVPKPLAEPCIFVYKVSQWKSDLRDFSTEYFIKRYNPNGKPIVRTPESVFLTKILYEKMKKIDFYVIYEHPLEKDTLQWELYKKMKREGNDKLADKVKEDIILPEKKSFRGIGITLGNAEKTARKIAMKRADEIARKINYPILDKIISFSE